MKSHLVSRRKQARILVSPQTIQQAAQEAEGLIAIMESTGDARLQQMQQVAKWLKNVAGSAAMQNQLDDQAYPQFAQQAEKYVRWVSQMSNQPQFQTKGIEQTEMPPVAQTAAKKRGAGSANENWVTDRNEKAEAREPVKAEVPRVAAKKVAQPGAPAGAPPAPAVPGAPAAAGAPAAPAPPQATPVTKPGNGNISADIKQMNSESLSNIVTAISKNLDPNDKAAWDFVQSLSGELKARPVEVEQGAARAASVKTALGLYDDTLMGGEIPGEEPLEEEPMGTGPGKCPQCDSATINGTYCHEQGCPNERKVWDPELQDWVRESECPECGSKLREGETCNCMEPMNEEPTDMQHFCFGGLNTASVDKQSAEDATFERCVHHVKEQNKEEGGSEKKPYNPWAVCHKSVGSKAGSVKVAVTPPGISEETAHDIKKEYPGEKDKAYATMWAIHNKKESSVSPHEVAYQAYREGKLSAADWTKIQAAQAEIVNTITAAGDAGGWFVHDEETGDVTESGGATPEVEEANKLEDEAPAKLDRPETTEPIKLNDNPLNSKSATEKKRDAGSALKKVKSLADKLQSMYLDAKEITQVNDSRMVREAVEAIFLAYDLLGQAAKVLGKQEMQEKAEEEAVKVKEKSKKSSILGDLILAAAEEERCEGCGKELSGSESEFCHQCAKKQRKGEGPKKPPKKDW